MASTAAEPQRLIAVSLGKIASSRSQRGGINLHKNLLVASVLHKARTAYMMENFQQMLAAKRAQSEQTNAQQRAPLPEKNGATVHETSHEAQESRSPSNPASSRVSESSDKENTPPRDSTNSVATKMDSQENNNSSHSKSESVLKSSDSNISASVDQQENRDYVSKDCDSPCLLKRRRSNASQDADTVLAKKAKYSDALESDSQCEPMQTETTQISNLVSIFNTGFGGLCNSHADNNRDMQMGFSRSDSLSCSAQVVDNHVGVHSADRKSVV